MVMSMANMCTLKYLLVKIVDEGQDITKKMKNKVA